MQELAFHPLASLMPDMSQGEFDQLADDIKDNGLLEPIWIYEDQIIDGRHRYMACKAAGVEIRTRPYEGDNPVAFVLSLNLARRHLNESQRAMVAAKLANLQHGQRADRVETSIEVSTAADMLNVGKASVERAKVVQRQALPEVSKAVESGEVAVSAAADFAKQEPEKQAEHLKAAQGNVVDAVKQFRNNLPTKKEARKQAAESAPGTAILGKDGKWHTDATDEDRARGELYLRFAGALRDVRDLKTDATAIVAAVPDQSSQIFGPLVDQTVELLLAVQAEWRSRHAA